MEVGVRVLAEPWNEAGVEPVRVATSYLVSSRSTATAGRAPVPPVLPESDEDRRRFAEAEIRRTHRLARREAIQRSRDDAGRDPVDPVADLAPRSADRWSRRPLTRSRCRS